jgi:hypothetical protein
MMATYRRQFLTRLAWVRLRGALGRHVLNAHRNSDATPGFQSPWPHAEPLIVIGAHRSGTTLITRILSELGLFVGAAYGETHYESFFFQDLNRMLFRAAQATWDVPQGLEDALENEIWCDGAQRWLVDECRGPGQVSYLGWKPWLAGKRIPLRDAWGWKDPRTTYTLPLWLRIFPRARVLHIYRNGVDVSQSLVTRQYAALERNTNVATLPRCMTLHGAFRIWAEYLAEAEKVVRPLDPARKLEVRYESFLQDPAQTLDCMARFAGLSPSPADQNRVLASLRADRAFAFVSSPALHSFYTQVADHPLMQKYGYHGIAPAFTAHQSGQA